MNTLFKFDYVYVLLIVILLSVLLFTYSKNKTLIRRIALQETNLRLSNPRNDNSFSDKVKILESNMKFNLENNSIRLWDIDLRSQKGEKVSLYAIAGKGKNYKLIVRISDMFCNTCNEYLILKLLRRKDEIGIDNIIIIGSFQNSNSMKILKDNLNIPFQIFSTNDNYAFNYLPIESENFPYCFILDSSKTIQHVYLPIKSEPEISEKYFNAIVKRYFDK